MNFKKEKKKQYKDGQEKGAWDGSGWVLEVYLYCTSFHKLLPFR